MSLHKRRGNFRGGSIKQNVLNDTVLPLAVEGYVYTPCFKYLLHTYRDTPSGHTAKVAALIAVGVDGLRLAGYGKHARAELSVLVSRGKVVGLGRLVKRYVAVNSKSAKAKVNAAELSYKLIVFLLKAGLGNLLCSAGITSSGSMRE